MAKICVICGEDCSGRPRIKDPKGHYYCKSCHEKVNQRLEGHRAADESARAAPADEAEPLGLLDDSPDESPARQAVPLPASAHVTREPERPAGPVGFFRSPAGVGLSALVVISVAAIIFGNLVTGLFFLFVALAMVNGYWIGGARIAALLGGLLVAALLAVPMGKAFEGLFSAVFDTTGITNRVISIAVCALVNVVVVTIILQVVIGRLQKLRPQWKPYDRLIGSGLGLLEGIVLGLLLIWTVLSLEPIATVSLAQTEMPDGSGASNPVSQKVVAMAQKTRDSVIGKIADAINPLDELRLITLFEKGLIVINEPGPREAFLNHPSIAGIKDGPSARQAMEMLAQDPEISLILEAGAISGDSLRAILNSPTILEILEETDLVAELLPLADEIEQAINEAFERKGRPAGFLDVQPFVDELVAAFVEDLSDADPRVRHRAAGSLGDIGPPAAAAVPALTDALQDTDAAVRDAAKVALRLIGPGEP